MSDALYHARLTPTQQVVTGRHRRFLDAIRAQAELRRKPILAPILVAQRTLPVRIIWIDADELAFGPIVARKDREALRPTCKDIIRATAQYFQVPKIEILSSRRTTNVVRPRQVAMYLCKTMTFKSFPFIGREMGGRDHTTCMHGVRMIQGELCAGNPVITEAVDYLTERLGGRPSV